MAEMEISLWVFYPSYFQAIFYVWFLTSLVQSILFWFEFCWLCLNSEKVRRKSKELFGGGEGKRADESDGDSEYVWR